MTRIDPFEMFKKTWQAPKLKKAAVAWVRAEAKKQKAKRDRDGRSS